MTAPLEHLRVLDLTRLLPGGFCTLLMADLGADVIKIEEPKQGDYMRWMPPQKEGVSAGHLALNRGKRSVTLNLKDPDGVAILRHLVRDADVLVESFRPGVMDRLGVGYDVLAGENERLVYCAITGYGQDGPAAALAGHDINYLGYTGVLDIIGERGGPPVDPGVQIADVGGGALMAAFGIMAALAERERTGRGRFVDISMADGAFSWLSFHGASYALTGQIPIRGAMRLSHAFACYRVYRCADDKYLTVGALEPQFWARLCSALGVEHLTDRQFSDEADQAEVHAEMEAIFASKPRDEWVASLVELDACIGPVNDMAEAYADPQLRARGMVIDQPLGDSTVPAIGNPVRLTGADVPPPRLPPGFGEHTDQVLADAGYERDRIADLRERGVI